MSMETEPKSDFVIEPALLLEAEIETLMIRLCDCDADAILRIEKLVSRIRMRMVVERYFH